MYSNSSAQSVLGDYNITENWGPPSPVSFCKGDHSEKEIAPSAQPGPAA
jgi:hypothetical protein